MLPCPHTKANASGSITTAIGAKPALFAAFCDGAKRGCNVAESGEPVSK